MLERFGEFRPDEPKKPKPEIDIETLFRFLRDLKEGNAYAARVLSEFAELDPKARELLETPQSPNYHAEGPKVGDHYRLLLTALELMRVGQMDYKTACTFLCVEGFAEEWNATVQEVQARPQLFEAFILEHDVGKADRVGYYYNNPNKRGTGTFVRKTKFQESSGSEIEKRQARTREYREMYAAFSAQHPNESDTRVAKLFYDAYEINVSYYGHEAAMETPDNNRIRTEVENRLGLTQEERRLVRFAVAEGGNVRETFKRVGMNPDHRAYERFVAKASKKGLNGEAAMRFLAATLVVDVVLGSKKVSDDGNGWVSDAKQVRRLWEARRERDKNMKEKMRRQEGVVDG